MFFGDRGKPKRGTYSEEVLKTAHEHQIAVIEMTGDAVKEFHDEIIRRYACQTYYEYPLFDNFLENFSICMLDGWNLLEDFIKDQPVCLSFELNKYENCFVIPNGFPDFKLLIDECIGYDFYTTNPSFDYLASYNDHYSLTTAGSLMEYMMNLKVVKKKQVPFHYQKSEKQPPPLTLEELKVMYPNAFRHFKD